jgi:PEP-CTERM motif
MKAFKGIAASAALVVAGFLPTGAHADLALCFDTGSDGSYETCIADGSAGDGAIGQSGFITANFSTGVSNLLVNIGIGTGAFVGGYGMDLGAVGSLAGKLTIALRETDMAFGSAGAQQVSFFGGFNSFSTGTSTFSVFVDDGNTSGALTTLVASGGSGLWAGSALLSNPFSTTLVMNLDGGNGATFSNDLQLKVPEPGMLALFGVALIGLGVARRRKS